MSGRGEDIATGKRRGGAGVSVLVVDDNEDARDTLEIMLESAGCRVSTAARGSQALQMIRDGLRPDVVLIDFVMPEMDGVTLYSHVCELPADVRPRCVFVTGVTSSHVLKLLQPNQVLFKPCSAQELLSAVGCRDG